MTPIFFPTMLSKVKRSLPDLTNTPVLSANTTLEKSTIFMRDSETVVDPHSMSAVSLTIASNRVRWSTSGQGEASERRNCRPHHCTSARLTRHSVHSSKDAIGASPAERSDASLSFRVGRSRAHEHADSPRALALLRACRERPRGCRTADERDEIASFQLIELHSVTHDKGSASQDTQL